MILWGHRSRPAGSRHLELVAEVSSELPLPTAGLLPLPEMLAQQATPRKGRSPARTHINKITLPCKIINFS